MISSVFIDRPRLAIVIAIVITLGGLLALTRIPVAQLPDIVPPQVEVTTRYPGASAEVLEATVAQPLESKIVGVDKMIYMKSTSGNDGSYTLTVSFELGTDADIDTVNVNNRVQTVISQLPPEVQLQGIKVQKKSSSILQFVNLYDESGKYDALFITNFAIINVLDELSRTPGVGEAKLFGGLDYSMRIWFDTARLTSLNLAPSDVIKAIQSQNVQASVGRIGARPVPENQQFQINVQTQGRLVDPEQFGNIVLRANTDGSTLRIKDVARVELGAMNDDNFSRLNGHSAVTIGVFLSPGSNAIATAAAVNATLEKVRPRFPEGLKARATYDTTVFVNDTIHEVLKTLFEAFVLVAFVKRALDGAMCTDVLYSQLGDLEREDRIILSVGGNDALQHIELLEAATAMTAREVLVRLRTVREDFRRNYAAVLDRLEGRPVLVLTVYNPCFVGHGMDSTYQQAAESAVSMFDDVIQLEARRKFFDILELRSLFSDPADDANPIEPSVIGGAKLSRALSAWVELQRTSGG